MEELINIFNTKGLSCFSTKDFKKRNLVSTIRKFHESDPQR